VANFKRRSSVNKLIYGQHTLYILITVNTSLLLTPNIFDYISTMIVTNEAFEARHNITRFK